MKKTRKKRAEINKKKQKFAKARAFLVEMSKNLALFQINILLD